MSLLEDTTDLHNLANQILVLLDAQVEAVAALDLPEAGFGAREDLSNFNMATVLRKRLLSAQYYAQTVVRQTFKRLEDIGPVEAIPPTAITLTPYGIVERVTGFSSYLGSGIQNLVAGVETAILNNRATVNEDQTPPDIDTFYDGNRFRANFADALLIRITMQVEATDIEDVATEMTLWMDIGSGTRLFEQVRPITVGFGIPETVTYVVPMYAGQNFADNGAILRAEADGAVEISSISYFITRLHKRV